MRPRLTYANVVATLALFLAVGGGGVRRVQAARPQRRYQATEESRLDALEAVTQDQCVAKTGAAWRDRGSGAERRAGADAAE